MSRFHVGMLVRLVARQDFDDWDEARAMWSEGQIVGPGRTFENYEQSYDWLVHFPAYNPDGPMCSYEWQLAPIVYGGSTPSEFSTLSDLLQSLGAEVKA